MLDHLGEDYLEASSGGRKKGLPSCVHEMERFGFTHADLGVRLASLWKLPEDVGLAIKDHHDPLSTFGENPRILIVALADLMAHHVQEGASTDAHRNLTDRMIRGWLGLSTKDLQHVLDFAKEILPSIVL